MFKRLKSLMKNQIFSGIVYVLVAFMVCLSINLYFEFGLLACSANGLVFGVLAAIASCTFSKGKV
jgi:hypothetical protein